MPSPITSVLVFSKKQIPYFIQLMRPVRINVVFVLCIKRIILPAFIQFFLYGHYEFSSGTCLGSSPQRSFPVGDIHLDV